MPADVTPLIDTYLTHLSVERRLAVNSIESYARDLNQLARFAAGQGQPLEALQRLEGDHLVRILRRHGAQITEINVVEQLLLLALPPPNVAARLDGRPQRYLTLWPVAYGDSAVEMAAALAS